MTFEEMNDFIRLTFSALLEKHAFQRVYEWKEINDSRSDQYNRYIVGYESQECRIAFYYEPGAIAVLLGTVMDKFDSLRDADSRHSSGWIGLSDLIVYMLKRHIEWYGSLKGRSYQERILEPLRKMARDFDSLSDKILQLCQDQGAFVQLKPKLEAFRREEIKRRFGIS